MGECRPEGLSHLGVRGRAPSSGGGVWGTSDEDLAGSSGTREGPGGRRGRALLETRACFQVLFTTWGGFVITEEETERKRRVGGCRERKRCQVGFAHMDSLPSGTLYVWWGSAEMGLRFSDVPSRASFFCC